MNIKIINTISGKLEKEIRCKNKNEAMKWAKELNSLKSPFYGCGLLGGCFGEAY